MSDTTIQEKRAIFEKVINNPNLPDSVKKIAREGLAKLSEGTPKTEASNQSSDSEKRAIFEKVINNPNLPDSAKKIAREGLAKLSGGESKTEAKKEKVVKQPKAKKEKVVKQPKAKKEKVVKQPKAEKDVEDEKPFDNDEYCREIIAQETEKKAKRKEAAEKRKDAPKKKEATKIKEGIERLEDKVEEKVSKGKITKAEIIKLIDNTKALLKSLEKQLKEFGTKKMAEGGNVEESYNYFYYKQPISKSQFLANVPKNWRKEIDEYYEYSYGGYRASLRDDSDIDAFAKGGNVGDLKVGDIFEGTPNATYEENWQLHKPSISYIIDNKTNRIVSIHNSPHEAIKERNKLNPHFKLHFKVYPKEHYQTKMAEGGNVEESEFKNMSAKDFVKEYYGINVFKSNPSEYFDIQKLSSSNDDKVEQFINKYKNEGYSIKKKSYSDFTGLLAAKRKNDINKLAKGGNVEGGYKIFVGHDHRKNHELYQVVGIDNDYVGEWHKDKKDAEDELKDLDGISDSVSKFAEGGNVGNGDKFTYMMLSRLQMDNDYYLGMGNRSARNLWAGSVDEQIKEMKRLWNSLPEDRKPEWLSMEDIKEYEKEMTSDKYAKGGSIKRTKNAIDADKNLRAMPKGERVSHPFAIIRKANGETFKRRNANQFGEVEGDGVYTENRANRTDKDQKKRFAEGGSVGDEDINKKLRSVKVSYSNGEIIATSMAAHLTDEEILNYFKIGKVFNIGNVKDNLQKVTKVEILDKTPKFAKGGSIKRTKNAIDADKNLRAMPKGERVSHPFAIIRKANGETFKRRNANQFGEVEGDGVYTENRANRTDKDQKKRF